MRTVNLLMRPTLLAIWSRHKLAIVTSLMWLRAVAVAAHLAPTFGTAAIVEVSALTTVAGALATLGARVLSRRYQVRHRARRA